MIIFTAIWADRHTDTSVHLFSTEEKAVTWAKETARMYDRHDELEEDLNSAMVAAGWLYYCTYSCEGDSIRVEPCTLDKEIS